MLVVSPIVARTFLGAAIVSPEVDGAAQDGLLEEPFELALMPLEPRLLLGDECQLRLGLGRAFLAGEHLLRAVDLDRLAVDRVVQGGGPEQAPGFRPGCGCVARRRWARVPCRARASWS